MIQVVGEQLEPVNPQTERDRCGTSLICSTTVDQMNGCWFSLVLKRHRDEQQTKTYAHTGWKHLYFKLAYARRPAMANNVGAPAAWICTRHSFKIHKSISLWGDRRKKANQLSTLHKFTMNAKPPDCHHGRHKKSQGTTGVGGKQAFSSIGLSLSKCNHPPFLCT